MKKIVGLVLLLLVIIMSTSMVVSDNYKYKLDGVAGPDVRNRTVRQQ